MEQAPRMKTILLFSMCVLCLCSCQVAGELSEQYYKGGGLAKRNVVINSQIGGVSSQKGSNGYQNDFDGQQSLADSWTGATGIVVAKGATHVSVAQEKTKQVAERQTTARAANARPPTITTPTVDPGTGTVLTPVVTQPAAAVGLGGKHP